MAILLVPTEPEVSYSTQKVRLEGRDYWLGLAYNEREDRWYLSISDDEQTPLVMGLKLVTQIPLLRSYHADPRVPPGDFIALTLTPDKSAPGFADLGSDRRVQLNYIESATYKELSP